MARRALVLASLGLAALAPGHAFASVPLAPLPPLAAGETALSWQLVGVGPDGRSLLLWVPGRVDRCGLPSSIQPRVDFAENDSTAVDFRLVWTPTPPVLDPSGVPVPLPCPAIAAGPQPPFVLPLGARVHGQRILGADRAAAPISIWNWHALAPRPLYPLQGHATPRAAPQLIGLNLIDAAAVLQSIGVTPSHTHVDRARHGYVADQAPRAGQPIVHHGPWMQLTGRHATN